MSALYEAAVRGDATLNHCKVRLQGTIVGIVCCLVNESDIDEFADIPALRTLNEPDPWGSIIAGDFLKEAFHAADILKIEYRPAGPMVAIAVAATKSDGIRRITDTLGLG